MKTRVHKTSVICLLSAVLLVLPAIAARYATLSPASQPIDAPQLICVGYEIVTNWVETATSTNMVVSTNGIWTATSSIPEPTANRLGYKLVEDVYPPCPTNCHAEARGWAETNRIYRVYEIVANPTLYRAWTPLTIMRGAKAQGFWAAMKAVLDANDAYDEFMACQYCAECDPAFVSIRAIIVAQIGEEATTAFLDGLKVEKTGTREELLEMAY